MNVEQSITAMRKALEMWTLQNLCDTGIMLGFLIIGLVAARGYLERFKAKLSLRVAIEAWETLIDLGADFLLLVVALIGLFITNTDIMADIKIALPWVPLAFLLMGAALIVRAFYGGHKPGSRPWWIAPSDDIGLEQQPHRLRRRLSSCWWEPTVPHVRFGLMRSTAFLT